MHKLFYACMVWIAFRCQREPWLMRVQFVQSTHGPAAVSNLQKSGQRSRHAVPGVIPGLLPRRRLRSKRHALHLLQQRRLPAGDVLQW
jgi:hypothetical protein